MPVDLIAMMRAWIAERRGAIDRVEAAIDLCEQLDPPPVRANGITRKSTRKRRSRRRATEGSVEERIVTAIREGASTMPQIIDAANVRAYDAKKFTRALVADGQLVTNGKGRWTTYVVATS